jgi:SNF2 family DNA or RNA helicase
MADLPPPRVHALLSSVARQINPAVALNEGLLPATLHPYQREAVKFILQRGGRGLLAHEMGLGKTPMALSVVAHFLDETPVLFVAPPVLLEQWASEILQWLPGTRRSDVQVIKAGKEQPSPSARFVIVSYTTLVGQKKDGAQTNAHLRATARNALYSVIVCDECHCLKSSSSQRTQTMLPMLNRARRVVLMSGTPMSNSCAADVYPVLAALVGQHAMPSLLQWNGRYCEENRKVFTGHAYIDRWVGVSEEHSAEVPNAIRTEGRRHTTEECR